MTSRRGLCPYSSIHRCALRRSKLPALSMHSQVRTRPTRILEQTLMRLRRFCRRPCSHTVCYLGRSRHHVNTSDGSPSPSPTSSRTQTLSSINFALRSSLLTGRYLKTDSYILRIVIFPCWASESNYSRKNLEGPGQRIGEI